MPIYTYECPVCFKTKDVFGYSSKDQIPKKEITCHHIANNDIIMKPIIAQTSFILKGPGWAKDGYNNGK